MGVDQLGEQAAARWDQPDAGIWEYRGREAVHTHSSLLCWAACDRLALIAGRLGLQTKYQQWRTRADKIRAAILEQAWSDKRKAFVATFGGEALDASLLLMPNLGLIDAKDPRFAATVERMEQELLHDGHYIYRYVEPDDFGRPANAFTVCTFWYAEAIAMQGRVEEARELFEHLLSRRNSLGLLAEDLDTKTGELWGNFPQTYSMVGLIHTAARLSRSWKGAF